GIQQQEFFAHYFERELYFRRNALLESCVTWDSVSTALYAIDPGSPHIKIYQDGQLSKAEYLDNYQDGYVIASRFKPNKLHNLLVAGATLIINKLDRYVEPIGALTQAVGDVTNPRNVANARIAIGGEGTFGQWQAPSPYPAHLASIP